MIATFRRGSKTKKVPIKDVEQTFPTLEEQIHVLVGLPEDIPTTLGGDHLAESSNSSSSPFMLKEKRVGRLDFTHSNSRTSLTSATEDSRLQELIAQYKVQEKDGNAGSRPPSPSSMSSKSSMTVGHVILFFHTFTLEKSMNTPKSISRSGSVRSSLGSKAKSKLISTHGRSILIKLFIRFL